MPSQLRNFVWGVDSIGRMHTLSTISQHWDLRSHGTDGRLLDFKQVTATKYSVWAIGCDQELYVYVHSGDVPIRCLEYTYENQVRNFNFFLSRKNRKKKKKKQNKTKTLTNESILSCTYQIFTQLPER